MQRQIKSGVVYSKWSILPTGPIRHSWQYPIDSWLWLALFDYNIYHHLQGFEKREQPGQRLDQTLRTWVWRDLKWGRVRCALDVLCFLHRLRYLRWLLCNSIGYLDQGRGVVELGQELPLLELIMLYSHLSLTSPRSRLPEWVILSKAPVALRWTRISLDLASRVNGPNALDRAILFLLSSVVRTIDKEMNHGLQGLLCTQQHYTAPRHCDSSSIESKALIHPISQYWLYSSLILTMPNSVSTVHSQVA